MVCFRECVDYNCLIADLQMLYSGTETKLLLLISFFRVIVSVENVVENCNLDFNTAVYAISSGNL